LLGVRANGFLLSYLHQVEATYDRILFLEENHSSPKITLSWADQTCRGLDCRTKSLSTKLSQVLLLAIVVAIHSAGQYEVLEGFTRTLIIYFIGYVV